MYSAIIAIRKSEFQPELIKLNGTTLLSKKISLLKKISKIDEIIIASDIEELKEIAKKENINFFLRNDKDTRDNAQNFIKHLIKVVSNKHMIFAPCTCVFFKENLLDECIEEYEGLDYEFYDSLITCVKLQSLILDDNGALNFNITPKELNTRKLSNLYSIKNACFIVSKNVASKYLNYWGKLPYKKIIDKNYIFDIKNESDFLFIKNNLRIEV